MEDKVIQDSTHVKNDVHIKTIPIHGTISDKIIEFRSHLCNSNDLLYVEYKEWCTDELLHRFLIARKYIIHDSYELLLSAFKYRSSRIPPKGIIALAGDEDWEQTLNEQGKTGSIYVGKILDKFGRPILLLDNTVQKTTNVNKQQIYLAWNLDYACHIMPSHVDKFVVWINLEHFSIFNAPSMHSTIETIRTLLTCYPERLGNLVFYQPTLFLHTVYTAITYLLDHKTVSKFHFIAGDVSENSQNHKLLSEIIGENWKDLTGVEKPHIDKCARGFNFEEHMINVHKKLQSMKVQMENIDKVTVNSNDDNKNDNDNIVIDI